MEIQCHLHIKDRNSVHNIAIIYIVPFILIFDSINIIFLLTFCGFMVSYNQGLGESSLDHSRRGEFLAIFLRANLI